MKIAVLTTVFPRWSGDFFGNYIYFVAREHARAGNEVRAVAPHAAGGASSERIDGVHVERFRYALPARLQQLAYGGGVVTELDRSMWARLLLPVFCIAFLIRSIGIVRWADVVHAHWTLAGFIGLALAKVFRKRSVLTVYGIEVFTDRYAFLTEQCLRWADQVICISTPTLDALRERFGEEAAEKSTVIAYGAPPAFLERTSDAIDVRSAHGIAGDVTTLLSVGRLIERKGTEHLLRALESLPMAVRPHLIVVGQGPQRPMLERLVDELDLVTSVTFTGAVPSDELVAYYEQCDVFVHPIVVDASGDVEGLGIVALEAMAKEQPVIASAAGGVIDVVADGETGVLVPPADPQALAAAIERLARNADLRRDMGRAGRRRVEERFSVPELSARILALYGGTTAQAAEVTS